ncbi:MAG: 50S ribosomal protein L17 [Candidatus Omnitrophota bacterium]
MRHAIAGNRLNRRPSWRKATVRDIAKSVLIHQRIRTTSAKAKEARKMVDRLITLGKKGSLVHKRRAYAILCDHKLVSTLFHSIAPRFQSRPGGYTRVLKLATPRRGDNAELVLLELTEKDTLTPEKSKKKAASKTAKKAAPKDVSQEEKPAEGAVEEKAEQKKDSKGKGLKGIFRKKKGDNKK